MQPQRQPRELRSLSDTCALGWIRACKVTFPSEFPSPQDPSLAEKAAEVAEQLMLQGTRLEAPTLKVRPLMGWGVDALCWNEASSVAHLLANIDPTLTQTSLGSMCRPHAGAGMRLLEWNKSTRLLDWNSVACTSWSLNGSRYGKPAGAPPSPTPALQAVVDALGKADALPGALPMIDAWLQQQEEALQDDANTRAPLQVGGETNGQGKCRLGYWLWVQRAR